jgi:hypothetical protein
LAALLYLPDPFQRGFVVETGIKDRIIIVDMLMVERMQRPASLIELLPKIFHSIRFVSDRLSRKLLLAA